KGGVRVKTMQEGTNNNDHHTSEISIKELIVRRGQSFKLTVKLAQAFKPTSDQLTMTVATGRPFISSFVELI
uniref:Transglutaminase N-terminal domain-containing protein n=1 Tax=Cyprinodon variegatus TaxID=28743 RepID=A0A3Q2DCV7_CYPVA